MLSANLKKEFTSAVNSPYYHLFGGIPQPEDPLQFLLGDRIERYQELLLDPDILACFQKRVFAVVAAEWEVQPGSDGSADEKAARLIKWILSEKLQFDRCCLGLLEAIVLGYKVAEIIWTQGEWHDPEDGKKTKVIYPSDIRVRSSDRFTFVEEPKPRGNASLWGYELRFLTTNHSIYGEPLPDKKFIIHSVGSKTSNPLGVGIGSALYWPHEFKKQAVMSALIFGDRFAQPTVIGKHLPEQNAKKLEQFVRSITEGTSGVIPDGMDVFLLEASRSSSQNFYEWLIGWCESQIKKVILSEMMTDAPQGLSGQPAQNDEKVRREITKLDADLLHACLNETLFTWITELNFREAKPPKVWRIFQESEDLNARVNRDRILQDMGFSLTFEKFTEIYGEGYNQPKSDDVSLQINGILDKEQTEPDSKEQIDQLENQPEETRDQDLPIKPSEVEFRAVIDRIIKYQGLEIGVEYLPGQVRFSGTRKLKSGYGHIRGKYGPDGRALDCYISPDVLSGVAESEESDRPLFEVEQVTLDGKFDQIKIMIGYASESLAKAAFLIEAGIRRFGSINQISPLSLDFSIDLSDPLPDDPMSGLIGNVTNAADRQIKDWLASVRNKIDRIAGSDKSDSAKFQEFQNQLIDFQASAPIETMAKAIAQSSLIAQLGGEYDAITEAESENNI